MRTRPGRRDPSEPNSLHEEEKSGRKLTKSDSKVNEMNGLELVHAAFVVLLFKRPLYIFFPQLAVHTDYP